MKTAQGLHYYSSLGNSKIRPYVVMVAITNVDSRTFSVRYEVVRNCFTMRGAARLERRLNARR